MTEARLVFRRRRTRGRPRVERADVKLLFSLPALMILSWCCPDTKWPRVLGAWSAAKSFVVGPRKSSLEKVIARALEIDAAASRAIVQANTENKVVLRLQVLRIFGPGGYHPSIHLEGRSFIDDALRGGNGVILWITHFVFNGVIAKIGLHEAGYAVSHISRPEHGFSKTRFGIRFLNPIRCQAEARYVKQRIVLNSANPVPAMRHAKKVLDENGILSITVGAWEGHRLVRIPAFGGHWEVAIGALNLAKRTGAKVCPVHVVCDEQGDSYRIIIRPPLALDQERDLDDMAIDAVQEYWRDVEPLIRRHPDQWRGWTSLYFDEATDGT